MPVDFPALRVETKNDVPVRADGDYVLYWMIGFRRTACNFSLDRAVAWARELNKPLVILEALRCGYRWASNRHHLFVIEGMAENARRLGGAPVLYYPYLEQEPGAGKGLLEALASRACVVVTDAFPCFFLPRMVDAAAVKVKASLEAVDSNGLLPLNATPRVFSTAFSFRGYLQKELPSHLGQAPSAQPFANLELPRLKALPEGITSRWRRAEPDSLAKAPAELERFPIDHTVGPAIFRGGSGEAEAALTRFLNARLSRYPEDRSEPAVAGTSQLSPYLHFGHLSAHQVFAEIAQRESWTERKLSSKAGGKREGFWGMSAPAEAFLDELVTWRELSHHFCAKRDDYHHPEAIPEWAQKTLAKHGGDPRPRVYAYSQFEAAATQDTLWNATQRQLVRDGWFHNAMRMLWGKKILHYTQTPAQAFRVMEELMGKYSLDGRNPNSYSGYLWVLGAFDRPWGPEREVFGTVRYMSSENALRKADLKPYLEKYGP